MLIIVIPILSIMSIINNYLSMVDVFPWRKTLLSDAVWVLVFCKVVKLSKPGMMSATYVDSVLHGFCLRFQFSVDLVICSSDDDNNNNTLYEVVYNMMVTILFL